jgi:MYXO-CTERM domain-containing protein
MRIAHLSLVALASASVVTAANAGYTGFQAIVRDAGAGRTFVDVFAGFNTAGDKLLNVFNMNIAVTGGAAFVQQAGVAPSKWKPIDDTSSDASQDSFTTLGGFSYGGSFFTSYSSAGDPNFTNYTTANATTIPALAGWYNGNPPSTDILAISTGSVSANWTGAKEGAAGSLSVWVGHFLVNKAISDTSWTMTFAGSASFNSGSNATDSRVFHNVPAPGALALLAVAGIAGGRRRR